MSHYANDPRSCRVDIWKPSGKWYMTIALVMDGHYYHAPNLHSVFRKMLQLELGNEKCTGMKATCLEPYHKNSHPISVTI